MVVGTSKPELESSELEVVNSEVGVGFIYTPKPQYAKCPSDCWAMKDAEAYMKARDSAIQAQAAGTTEMSAATCEKSNILHDQVALSLIHHATKINSHW